MWNRFSSSFILFEEVEIKYKNKTAEKQVLQQRDVNNYNNNIGSLHVIRLFWGLLLLCSANNSDKKGTTNDNTHRPFIHIYTDNHTHYTYTYTSSYNLSRMKNILHNREIISSLVLGTLLVVAVADIVALWIKIDIYIRFLQLGGVIPRKKSNAIISELRNINIRVHVLWKLKSLEPITHRCF